MVENIGVHEKFKEYRILMETENQGKIGHYVQKIKEKERRTHELEQENSEM